MGLTTIVTDVSSGFYESVHVDAGIVPSDRLKLYPIKFIASHSS
jgi:hypothetical protein